MVVDGGPRWIPVGPVRLPRGYRPVTARLPLHKRVFGSTCVLVISPDDRTVDPGGPRWTPVDPVR